MKILTFLILHRMVRKSPDKQWNRQNSILYHETIPLSPDLYTNALKAFVGCAGALYAPLCRECPSELLFTIYTTFKFDTNCAPPDHILLTLRILCY
jgi:hypothetical protein